jgi:hypothetical protein
MSWKFKELIIIFVLLHDISPYTQFTHFCSSTVFIVPFLRLKKLSFSCQLYSPNYMTNNSLIMYQTPHNSRLLLNQIIFFIYFPKIFINSQ